jgi:site-specific DNA-cytosine methylase
MREAKDIRVLVACEESQTVCKAFRERGFTAYSCDILPCSGGHPEWHLQQDVTPLLKEKWDMIIAFPPCTDLCVSGARWFPQKIADGTQQASIDFFMLFANADCPKIVIENPIGIMSSKWRKPNQIIQPWMFGDNATKSTCLWLKGLPNLIPSITEEPELEYVSGKDGKYRMQKWMYDIRCQTVKGGHRANLASKTFPGIAKAMAEQWAGYQIRK